MRQGRYTYRRRGKRGFVDIRPMRSRIYETAMGTERVYLYEIKIDGIRRSEWDSHNVERWFKNGLVTDNPIEPIKEMVKWDFIYKRLG